MLAAPITAHPIIVRPLAAPPSLLTLRCPWLATRKHALSLLIRSVPSLLIAIRAEIEAQSDLAGGVPLSIRDADAAEGLRLRSRLERGDSPREVLKGAAPPTLAQLLVDFFHALPDDLWSTCRTELGALMHSPSQLEEQAELVLLANLPTIRRELLLWLLQLLHDASVPASSPTSPRGSPRVGRREVLRLLAPRLLTPHPAAASAPRQSADDHDLVLGHDACRFLERLLDAYSLLVMDSLLAPPSLSLLMLTLPLELAVLLPPRCEEQQRISYVSDALLRATAEAELKERHMIPPATPAQLMVLLESRGVHAPDRGSWEDSAAGVDPPEVGAADAADPVPAPVVSARPLVSRPGCVRVRPRAVPGPSSVGVVGRGDAAASSTGGEGGAEKLPLRRAVGCSAMVGRLHEELRSGAVALLEVDGQLVLHCLELKLCLTWQSELPWQSLVLVEVFDTSPHGVPRRTSREVRLPLAHGQPLKEALLGGMATLGIARTDVHLAGRVEREVLRVESSADFPGLSVVRSTRRVRGELTANASAAVMQPNFSCDCAPGRSGVMRKWLAWLHPAELVAATHAPLCASAEEERRFTAKEEWSRLLRRSVAAGIHGQRVPCVCVGRLEEGLTPRQEAAVGEACAGLSSKVRPMQELL